MAYAAALAGAAAVAGRAVAAVAGGARTHGVFSVLGLEVCCVEGICGVFGSGLVTCGLIVRFERGGKG